MEFLKPHLFYKAFQEQADSESTICHTRYQLGKPEQMW